MTHAQRRWALVAIAAGVCFAVITLWVTVFETLPGDNLVLRVARALHHRKLDRVMHDYSDLSELIVAIALLCAAWIAVTSRGQRRRRALVLIGAVGLSLAIKEITSQLVVRPGPQLYGGPYQIYGGTDEYPSGHATATLALSAVLLILLWNRPYRGRLIAASAFFVGSIGLARVLLESHFASDVLAGWAVAIAVVGALAALVDVSDAPAGAEPDGDQLPIASRGS
jgi:membrane-associated phospholipid phosphatase